MKPRPDWLTGWHLPEPDDHIVYMTTDQIAHYGGVSLEEIKQANVEINTNQVNKGMVILQRWCRLNCTSSYRPVNVMGKTGMAFKNQSDALLFKLTWA